MGGVKDTCWGTLNK